MRYTIDDFWVPRLKSGAELDDSAPLVQGWSFQKQGLPTFKEAPLTLDAKMDAVSDPENAQILFVSAPGAVGKTTLAKQIAYKTRSIYVDLATAEPVGGNTLSGGLYRSEVRDDQNIAILIDGLDEARLKVTHEAFEAFLKDVAALSSRRTTPTVIFGRIGAIQYARIFLHGSDVKIAELEIGYYGFDDSVELADLIIKSKTSGRHASVERKAAELLLQQLREQTRNDESRFAGYAPVVHAVAMRVSGENNPRKLISQIESGDHPVTLKDIASAILEREREKLNVLSFEDSSLSKKLYKPDEQIKRLIARIYSLQPPKLPPMNVEDTKKYSQALETWVAEHPFLDGGGGHPATAVFDAVISAEALRSPVASAPALKREIGSRRRSQSFFVRVLRRSGCAGTQTDPGRAYRRHLFVAKSRSVCRRRCAPDHG